MNRNVVVERKGKTVDNWVERRKYKKDYEK